MAPHGSCGTCRPSTRTASVTPRPYHGVGPRGPTEVIERTLSGRIVLPGLVPVPPSSRGASDGPLPYPAVPARLHADRAVGGDRHHRRLDRPLAAGRAEGA